MRYICNPINFPYNYQFLETSEGKITLFREAADPSMVLFKEKYYIFPSMTKGMLVSDDLCKWEFVKSKNIPAYDYAPDACIVGDYLYLCASSSGVSDFYRTKDPESDVFEVVKGSFPLGDPKLFCDDDNRLYMYYGGAAVSPPLFGVELDPETLKKKSEPIPLLVHKIEELGYERAGEDHYIDKKEQEQKDIRLRQYYAKKLNMSFEDVTIDFILKFATAEQRASYEATKKGNGFIEGAWMNKINGKYYLQYSCPGTEFNVYADGVYVSDKPLGPFVSADNNPFSYSPGGFCPGAGHGSTISDKDGNLWHTSTMRISKNHAYERRLGIWQAGIDENGEMFCDQRYGDWPKKVDNKKQKLFENPEWMLLSYGKKVYSSSGESSAHFATDENVQTWWRAETNKSGEWIDVDLGSEYDIHAIQVNFADLHENVKLPNGKEIERNSLIPRYIDDALHSTQWLLTYSADGNEYKTFIDKSKAKSDLPHDFVVNENGIKARYIRLTVFSVPYAQNACISGLRVFGKGNGKPPEKPKNLTVKRTGHLDMNVSFDGNAVGYNILWGLSPDKLYHSYLIYGKTQQEIRALVKDKEYYIRVDSFNENGITHGDILKVEKFAQEV